PYRAQRCTSCHVPPRPNRWYPANGPPTTSRSVLVGAPAATHRRHGCACDAPDRFVNPGVSATRVDADVGVGEFAAPPDSVIAMGAPPDAATPNWSAQLTDATTGREFTPLAVPHRARHIDILRTRNRAQQQHPSAERKSGLRHRITRFGRRSRLDRKSTRLNSSHVKNSY